MRKIIMIAVLCASLSLQAAELDTLKSVELQEVEVMATRATKKTPMAFTNMPKSPTSVRISTSSTSAAGLGPQEASSKAAPNIRYLRIAK